MSIQPIEWSPLGNNRYVPIVELKTSPLHVDTAQIHSYKDAHFIIGWDYARRMAGWVGIINIKEVAAKYIELLPPDIDTEAARQWAEGVPYTNERLKQALADQLNS